MRSEVAVRVDRYAPYVGGRLRKPSDHRRLMRYSVYNYDRQVYDYFEGPGPKGTHAGAPPVSSGRSQLGATVEQAAWKVPLGAKKVGEGVLPQGRVAAMGGFPSLGDVDTGQVLRAGALAVIAYFAWRAIR